MVQTAEQSLFDGHKADTKPRMRILVPYPVDRAYDYLVPEGLELQPGEYVEVPLGRREVVGVVWGPGGDDEIDPAKLKYIIGKHDCPPMTQQQRDFIDWVAKYTLSDRGSVLKMALSNLKALDPPKPDIGYIQPNVMPDSLTPKRQKVLDVLKDDIPRRGADLAREAGCSAGVIRAMADAQLIGTVEMTPPSPCQTPNWQAEGPSLSAGQQTAADALVGDVQAGGYRASLLDGVTGAGKTEVYFAAIAEALKQDKQVLVLLPEIALSTQFFERFEKRFGTAPAVWHSEVTELKRRTTWRGVAQGQTKVVVGARSALFLPFRDLGLIIVDEEHDTSFKQEEGVMYNARDMAVLRAHQGDIPIVLVSATPALETMINVEQGRYQHLNLPSRHGGATLPDVHVIDLKEDKPERQRFLSPSLKKAVADTVTTGEQALLFINRRGYAPLTICRTCGHRFQCPSCTAWLVEHRFKGRLQCHHCGHTVRQPDVCPECEDEGSLAACGPGVERIAEEVREFLPDARTLVLASDVTSSPAAIQDAIGRISDHKVDVVIGTQIIAKGHHFPSLTCVGVVDADLGLSGGDLRASERTYQLLHQVAGRAGRGEKPGHVYLQTFMPEHRVIQALTANDRDNFLGVEAQEREEAQMPPFGKLAGVIVAGPKEELVDKACRDLARAVPRYEGVQILGPAPAPMAILRGKHRRRFLVKAQKDVGLQKVIREWLSSVKTPNTVRVKADIDPQSFF